MRALARREIENLIERAKNLDRRALSELCIYFYPRIYRYVFYRVKPREDVEDITSEVFVRMVKSLNKQRGSFQAWLFRIASNLIVDHYRRSAKQKEMLVERGEAISLESASDNPEKVLLQRRIRQALSKLTEAQQQVITLKFLGGYHNDEIAEIMGKSVGAVKALQFRALASLKGILQKED